MKKARDNIGKRKNDISAEKIANNFLVIKQLVYYCAKYEFTQQGKHMSYDQIIEMFYRYIYDDETSDKTTLVRRYSQLAKDGVGNIDTCSKKLISCEFPANLFDRENPQEISLPYGLKAKINGIQGLNSPFTDDEIMTILCDNPVVADAVRNVVNEILNIEPPDEDLYDFADSLPDLKLDGKYLQKDLKKKIIETYDIFNNSVE